MRILLPPSEAKRPGGSGPPVTYPPTTLGNARRRVADAVTTLVAGPDAAAVLGLPAGSAADDLAANAAIDACPTVPALDRYTGVVYQGLAAPRLPRQARARADESVLIFSGLLGVVRGDEPVPRYRVPASAVLPGLGGLAAFWRPTLDGIVPGLIDDELVVDLRSADYAALWRPPDRLRAQVVRVRVLSERPGRTPAVISHPSKLGKGLLAGQLVRSRAALRRPAQIVAAWRRAGGVGAVETAHGLDLIAPAVPLSPP